MKRVLLALLVLLLARLAHAQNPVTIDGPLPLPVSGTVTTAGVTRTVTDTVNGFTDTVIDATGAQSVTIFLTTTNLDATIQAQLAINGGTYYGQTVYETTFNALTELRTWQNIVMTGATVQRTFQMVLPPGGTLSVRMHVTAYTAGSGALTLIASSQAHNTVGSLLAYDTTTNHSGLSVMAANASGLPRTPVVEAFSTYSRFTNGLVVHLASGDNAAAPITAQIGDGTNQVAVKAASTAAVAIDPALVTRTVQLPTALAAGGGLKIEGVAGGVAVPISAASLPLPSGAATAALQTQPGVDIGDVTVNNGAGAAAVNVQDGGNSLTVDGTVGVSGNVTVVQPTGTNLHIVCDGGTCGGASPFADNSAFTFGTSGISNIGFIVDDVATNAVAENSAGAPRMTGNRIAYADLSLTGANATALKVDGSAVTQPVSGTVTAVQATGTNLHVVCDSGCAAGAPGQQTMANSSPVVIASDQSAIPVTGTFFQATQPISATALPLPAGAATAALQTQPGVDIGDVTINNAAGAAAVNVQDGGNSLTVDGATATAPATTDAGLVVRPLPRPLVVTGALLNIADTLVITLDGRPYVHAAVLADSSLAAGQVFFEVSYDAGVSYQSAVGQGLSYPAGNTNPTPIESHNFATLNNTDFFNYAFNVGPSATHFRLRVSVALTSSKTFVLGASENMVGIGVTQVVQGSGGNGLSTQAWWMKLMGATGTIVGVKAASTAVAAADPALVVGISPNNNVLVQGAAASGAAKAANPVQIGGVFNTTQPTVTTGQAVEAQATARGELMVSPGVSGFAVSGTVNATPPTLTKGTQGATGFSTQDLKDAGRTAISFYANNFASGTTTTEKIITWDQSKGTGAITAATASYTITNGKTLRITGLQVATRGHATATIQTTTFSLRLNTAGACVVTSTPILFAAQSATAAVASDWDRVILPIPDGYEIAGNGTIALCITANSTFVTNAPTWAVNLIGYEY